MYALKQKGVARFLERAERNPRLDTLLTVPKGLGITVSEPFLLRLLFPGLRAPRTPDDANGFETERE